LIATNAEIKAYDGLKSHQESTNLGAIVDKIDVERS
jgi:hypothetical protein